MFTLNTLFRHLFADEHAASSDFLISSLKSSKFIPLRSLTQSWNLSGSAIPDSVCIAGDALGDVGIHLDVEILELFHQQQLVDTIAQHVFRSSARRCSTMAPVTPPAKLSDEFTPGAIQIALGDDISIALGDNLIDGRNISRKQWGRHENQEGMRDFI